MATTDRQKVVIQATSENLGTGRVLSKRDILKKAGYSPSVQDTPSIVFGSKGVQEELRPLLKLLKAERDAALAGMAKKRRRASYRDLMDATDKLTKNIQLLEGKETSSAGFILRWKQ